MALIKCPDCKKKISDSVDACPKCGCKITEEIKENAHENEIKESNKLVVALSIGIFVCIVFIFSIFFVNKMQIKKQQEQQKVEMEKQNKEKAEEKKFISAMEKAKESADTLYDYLSKKSVTISHTWYNAIYEKKDNETKKYTLKNGNFKDFSDAVDDCVDDLIFSDKASDLYNTFLQNKTAYEEFELSKKIKNEFSSQKEKVDEYIENIQSFYNSLSRPTGNYDDFTANVNNLEYKIADSQVRAANALFGIVEE